MPSSLLIGALVVAWLVVLVPMIARRRQEVAKTADSVLAARVVRSGGVRSRMEEYTMPDADETRRHQADDAFACAETDGDYTVELPLPSDDTRDPMVDPSFEYDYREDDQRSEESREAGRADDLPRQYRPGRGGFDAESAEIAKQARYAYRRRVVLVMILTATGSALVAAVVMPMMWWAHGAVDFALVSYLSYLRRQVRIEEEIRQRRLARMHTTHREAQVRQRPRSEPRRELETRHEPRQKERPTSTRLSASPPPRPGVQVVDIDEGDPEFEELATPDSLPYRRAVGE